MPGINLFMAMGLAVSLLFCFTPEIGAGQTSLDYPVKVLILSHVRSLDLKLLGPVKVKRFYTNEDLGQLGSGLLIKVKPAATGLVLGKEEYKIFGINLICPDIRKVNFSINKRNYRGGINLIRETDMSVSVINQIPLEDYLGGVLPSEIPAAWPDAALEAQAIAARTYALYEALRKQDKDFYLQADIRSQVYGGAGKEKNRTSRAVKKTRGKILTYKGYIFPAYFHAACGGKRQDAARVWGIDLKPLKTGPCGFCAYSPHQSWQKELTAEQVRQKISAAADLGRIGPVYVIDTLGRDRSGRVVKVKIGHSEGSFSILADKFRMIMGPNNIKSTNFKVKRVNNKFIFSGHGWGHGVGFCQWGAAGMAEKGYSAEQILKFYYPDSKITRVSDYIK